MFVATGSFFLGQENVFPQWFRQTGLPLILAVFPLLAMLYFLVINKLKSYRSKLNQNALKILS